MTTSLVDVRSRVPPGYKRLAIEGSCNPISYLVAAVLREEGRDDEKNKSKEEKSPVTCTIIEQSEDYGDEGRTEGAAFARGAKKRKPESSLLEGEGGGAVEVDLEAATNKEEATQNLSPLRHRCDVQGCDFITKRKGTLKQHKSDVHNVGVTWHFCHVDGCDYKAKQKSNLKQHMSMVHKVGVVWQHCDVEGCTFRATRKVRKDSPNIYAFRKRVSCRRPTFFPHTNNNNINNNNKNTASLLLA